MERFWLQAQAFGLAIYPLSSVTQLFARVGAPDSGFSHEEEATLSSIRSRCCQLFGQDPSLLDICVFRIGHAAPPLHRSKRWPLSDLLAFSPPLDDAVWGVGR